MCVSSAKARGFSLKAFAGFTGLRRDAGNSGRNQVNGQQSGGANPQWQYIPAIRRLLADTVVLRRFEIRKRTGVGFGWVKCDAGKRAAGVGYVGSPVAGWRSASAISGRNIPPQLDVRGAAGDQAEVTMLALFPRRSDHGPAVLSPMSMGNGHLRQAI